NMMRFQSVTSSASAAAGINTASTARKNPKFPIFFIKLLVLGEVDVKRLGPNANAVRFLRGTCLVNFSICYLNEPETYSTRTRAVASGVSAERWYCSRRDDSRGVYSR